MDNTTFPENNPALRSFVEVAPDSNFSIQNLPFGIFTTPTMNVPRVGVAIGDYVLDVAALADHGLLQDIASLRDGAALHQSSLNAFISLGRPTWRALRARLSQLLRSDVATLRDNAALRAQVLLPLREVSLHLPIKIGSYTDFYSSKEHARNVGIMFRGKDNPLLPNWLHLPVAYDGRASSIVVSGTAFHRPMGQLKPSENEPPIHAACQQLDTEVEVAFVVGAANAWGEPITVQRAPDCIFGMVLLSDWSARDIQKWEYVPLGPFLGKNFCTSISPWIVTLDALEPFRQAGCEQEPTPLPYLHSSRDWSYAIQLELLLKTPSLPQAQCVSHTNYQDIYWDFCQQLAHHTMGGCNMAIGDIFASGTISGSTPDSYGSLLELTWAGANPLQLADGETRRFLQDGDTAIIRGWCQGDGYRVGFGEVSGTVLPARQG